MKCVFKSIFSIKKKNQRKQKQKGKTTSPDTRITKLGHYVIAYIISP